MNLNLHRRSRRQVDSKSTSRVLHESNDAHHVWTTVPCTPPGHHVAIINTLFIDKPITWTSAWSESMKALHALLQHKPEACTVGVNKIEHPVPEKAPCKQSSTPRHIHL